MVKVKLVVMVVLCWWFQMAAVFFFLLKRGASFGRRTAVENVPTPGGMMNARMIDDVTPSSPYTVSKNCR
jgi:hypothetical protein